MLISCFRACLVVLALVADPGTMAAGSPPAAASERRADDPANWPLYGRTAEEQHYSPLEQIDARNIGRLGLAWSMDLDAGNSVSAPLAVDGVLYFAVGYSIVHAVDAATGKPLWTYDPGAAVAAGRKLRQGWGIRGIAYWDHKIYVGTHDGRLLAIDASTGKPVWSVVTIPANDARFISGPPRVFNGKV